MKQEDLIVGAWYRQTDKNNVFGKLETLKGLTNNYFPSKEYIVGTNYDNTGNFFAWNIDNLIQVNLEEIQEYLPDNHPDKMLTFKQFDNLEPLLKILNEIKLDKNV